MTHDSRGCRLRSCVYCLACDGMLRQMKCLDMQRAHQSVNPGPNIRPPLLNALPLCCPALLRRFLSPRADWSSDDWITYVYKNFGAS